MTDRPTEPVWSSVVDTATVDELFREVETACVQVTARVRRSGGPGADIASATLVAARAALDDGDSVQLRYEHDGVAWSDTLQPQPDGVRLIRCRLPEIRRSG